MVHIEDVPSFFFFFSSRRRHTRSDRDWSSDVCSSDLRGRRRAASAVLDAGRKRAGMAEPTVASLPALDAGSRAGGAGRVSVGREHAAHSRGALSAAGSGAAVEERGEPPGGAAGGRLPGLAEARPGRRTDRVSLPGCDLPEGAQRGKSRFAARAGGAGGARRRGEGAAELGHGRGGAHGSMGGAVGESGGAEDGPAAAGDYRRQRGVGRRAGGGGAGGRAAGRHGGQAEEPGEQSAAAQPRGAARGLSPHRLRRGSRRGGAGARTVPGPLAQAVPGGGGESGS